MVLKVTDRLFLVVLEKSLVEQGGFKGVLKGIQDVGAGAGHGKGGKGELDKTNTEGKDRIWRDESSKVDGGLVGG